MNINKNTVKIPGEGLSCVPSLFSKAYWLAAKTCQKNRATWTLVAISKTPSLQPAADNDRLCCFFPLYGLYSTQFNHI
jgi:hypothetical protein